MLIFLLLFRFVSIMILISGVYFFLFFNFIDCFVGLVGVDRFFWYLYLKNNIDFVLYKGIEMLWSKIILIEEGVYLFVYRIVVYLFVIIWF